MPEVTAGSIFDLFFFSFSKYSKETLQLMVSDAKRTKNTAIIVRKARTGTQCLSCPWWTWPGHCSENFEQSHLRSLPKLSKISIERQNFSLLQKRQFKDLFLVKQRFPLVPIWEHWMQPLVTEVQLYGIRKPTVSQNSVHGMTHTGIIFRIFIFFSSDFNQFSWRNKEKWQHIWSCSRESSMHFYFFYIF